MFTAYKDFWARGTKFKGRSTRSQYWRVVLCNVIITLLSVIIGGVLTALGVASLDHTMGAHMYGSGFILLSLGAIILFNIFLYACVELVPSYALLTRRFHDVGLSGWWIWALIGFHALLFIISLLFIAHALQETDPLFWSLSSLTNSMTKIKDINIISGIIPLIITLLPTNCHKHAFRENVRR